MACSSSTGFSNRGGLLVAILAISFFSACSREPDLPTYGVVSDFELTDQSAKAFQSKSLEGKVWIADFIFTNCAGPCPRMTQQLRGVQKRLSGTPVQFVSFTVDPDRDTPPVLTEYANRFQADLSNWTFLTGPKPTLQQLNRKVFLLGDITPQLDHSTRFILIDRKSRIRGYYTTGQADETEKLISDARALSR